MNILIIVEIPEIGGEMKESVHHQLIGGAVTTGTSPLQSDHGLTRKMTVPGLAGQKETEHPSLNAFLRDIV
jgi:hypothetical protein